VSAPRVDPVLAARLAAATQAFADQEAAWARFMELLPSLATVCEPVWNDDGDGGRVIAALRRAMHERGHTPLPLPDRSGVPRVRKAIPQSVRMSIFERDDYRCQRCSSRTKLTIDHVWPWAKGGTDDPDNLQTLCKPCNELKGDRV
jgi:hypothetical protein